MIGDYFIPLQNLKRRYNMTYILILLSIFFIVVGLLCSKNNFLAPSVLTGFVWCGGLVSYLICGSSIADLSMNFYICLAVWIIGTCMSSLVTQSASYHDSKLSEPSKLLRDIYLFISVISLPQLYFFASVALINGASGNWALDLRLAALGQGSGFKEIFSGIFVIIWQVTILLELLCYDPNKKWRLIVASVCYLSFGVITMSKIIFLNYFLYACSILYFKKHLRLKQIFMGVCVLLLLFFSLQSIRMAIKFSDVSDSFVNTYVVSNFFAFDTLEPYSSNHFGENTFRILYSIAYKLGFSSIEPVEAILEWIQKPIQTNTYTAMYPFYVDFGIPGIFIFSSIMGLIYGWLFKKSQTGSNFHILIYAIAITIIVLQYAADQFFTTLTGNIKLFVFLIIPFLLTKHNLLVIKEKIETTIYKA